MSGYPPGVTGREYAIAGPDGETDEQRECPACGWSGIATVSAYAAERWWNCPDPIDAHPLVAGGVFPVTGRTSDGAWTTTGYICLTCGSPVPAATYDALLEGKVVDEHPASGGCGRQIDEVPVDDGPDPDQMRDEALDREWEDR